MSDTSASSNGATLRYPFAFARPELIAGKLFGIRPDNSEVVLDGDRLVARFGPWTVDTPLANVAGASLSGPYSWLKIIGPAHLSLRDQGITFATNDQRGVCIKFREPVRGIDALGIVKHPALTVTVADPVSLIEVLERAAQLAEHVEARAERAASRPGMSEPEAPTVEDVVDEVADDLLGMTAKELRERAKELGVDGASSMKKDELIEVLSHGASTDGRG